MRFTYEYEEMVVDNWVEDEDGCIRSSGHLRRRCSPPNRRRRRRRRRSERARQSGPYYILIEFNRYF
jgi:hypothetical protein